MIPDWQLPPGTDRGLWDYLHNESMVRAYDASLADSSLLKIDVAFALKQITKPCRLIDLGCGTGRLLITLAERGYTCLGVDLSAAMLQLVAEKARLRGLSIPCLQANLVELEGVTTASFDAAACLFSTLGMIRGTINRRKFLAHAHRILVPGGIFILHVHNTWFRLGCGLGKKGIERGDRTMPQAYGGAALTLHHYSRREIRQELHEAGFAIREIQPVSLRDDGKLKYPWFFPAIRTYGYLIAAHRRDDIPSSKSYKEGH